MLIGKNLLQYAGIEKDAVLFAYLDRIEIWDKGTYYGMLDAEPDEFSELAEQVLGEGSSKENEQE